MDFQTMVNFVLGSLTGIIGWLARTLWDAVQTLKSDLADLREDIANNRVHKSDMQSVFDAVFKKLDRIEDKIDQKADKK